MSEPRTQGVRLTGYESTLARLIGLPPALYAAPACDIRKTHTLYVDNQGPSDRCVGEAFGGGFWIATSSRWSPRGIYVGARSREVARALGNPIPDVGCDPHHAAEGCVSLGVYPRDARDDDFSQATSLNTWSETIQLRKCDASNFTFISGGDLDNADLYNTAGYGVVQWMFIDESWQALSGAVWGGMVGPSKGGHATVKIGYTGLDDEDYDICWNSYGSGWGEGGFCMIPRKYLRKHVLGYCAITGGPVS